MIRRIFSTYWGIFLLLAAWQAWVVANRFNPIVMPTPAGVFVDLITHPAVYLYNSGITFAVALAGLIGGFLIGTILAIIIWFSPFLSGLVSPLAVLFSSVPVVTLIPIIARVLGYNFLTEVTIVVRDRANLFVRIPRWTPRESVQLKLNNKPVELCMIGDYALVPRDLLPGEVILTYGLPVEQELEHTGGVDYTLTWRGDEVMGITPNHGLLPLYPTCAPKSLKKK